MTFVLVTFAMKKTVIIENNDGQLARENCWPRVGQELEEREYKIPREAQLYRV